jgi:LacI family transcriptional regulator
VGSSGPTSRDVAKRAQVSQATVSAVLNKSRYVSPAVVERVQAAISELAYQPNAAARTLRTGRTGVIGLVVPSIVSPYWSGFVRSVSRVATERGLSLIITESDEDDETERLRLAMLLERQIDGVLLATRSGANRDFIASIAKGTRPLVLVDSHLDGVPVDSIRVDDEDGTYQAVKHLLGHGRRRIGLINLPEQRFGARSRLVGYRRALDERGIAGDAALVRHAGFSELDGFHATQELLALPAPPDALLVGTHLMTIGALHAATEAGRKIPQDLALFGFDDTPWSQWTTPPLSLVDDPRDDLGVRAVGAVLRRLERSQARPLRQVLPTRLVLRRSCGCPYDPSRPAPAASREAALRQESSPRSETDRMLPSEALTGTEE